MIESKLKAKHCNRGQLFLVGSRQHGVASNEDIGCSTDHPLNADGYDLR